jgi:peroxiredoxin Q/BCP
MHKLVARLGLAMAVGFFATVSGAQEDGKVELKVGDKAPAFSLVGSDGKTYTLEQFKGEKPVVIAFFPKAFTGG